MITIVESIHHYYTIVQGIITQYSTHTFSLTCQTDVLIFEICLECSLKFKQMSL